MKFTFGKLQDSNLSVGTKIWKPLIENGRDIVLKTPRHDKLQ